MNILVPLAGKEESFVENFGDIKPFIPIDGIALIEFVLQSLPFPLDNIIFVCLREHEKRFDVGERLRKIFGSGVRLVWAEELTEGAACSALLAAQYIDTDEDLLIDLVDIYFEPLDMYSVIKTVKPDIDGVIPICRNTWITRPWGYVDLGENDYVHELKEKEIKPTSLNATLGLYYFSKGADYVKYAQRMIHENRRLEYNNLFYIGPVYNSLIDDGRNIAVCDTKIVHTLGSPEDINAFMKKLKT